MSRTLRYTLLTLLWVLVGGYLLFAALSARRARSGRLVERLEIEVADSSSRGCLVSSARVREWIAAARPRSARLLMLSICRRSKG